MTSVPGGSERQPRVHHAGRHSADRHSADRRRFFSPWFKRRMTARVVATGFVVLAAVCVALGEVGIAAGAVVVGIAAVVSLQRRWRKRSSIPPAPPS